MGTIVIRKGAAGHSQREFAKRQMDALNQDTEWLITVEPLTSANRRRTLDQNGLQHKWHMEAAQQLRDATPEDYRAYCKLHFGIPILRAECPEFRAQYNKTVLPLTYEQKLELMKAPIDFPVTRLMTVKQKSAFLDAICQHYMSLGVVLTIPEEVAA